MQLVPAQQQWPAPVMQAAPHAPPVAAYTDGLDLVDPTLLRADRVKQLVYGDFGQGKTTYGATAPFCLFVSSEGGEASLMNPAHAMDPRSRIVRVNTWDDMRKIYDRVRTNQNGWGEFESIVIDSLSDLQKKCLFEVMEEAEKKDPKRPKGIPQRNDYQQVTNLMERMVVRFRNLPKHVIFLAQYRNDKNMEQPGTGTTSRAVRADMTPAVYKGVAGAVDILSYIQIYPNRQTGQMDRVMIFEDPSMTYSVKQRFRLPPFIVDPTFDKVLGAINAGSRQYA